MKSCAKILFGIFCMFTSFILLYYIVAQDLNASTITTVLALAQLAFFIVGLYYGISGIAGINKELKK